MSKQGLQLCEQLKLLNMVFVSWNSYGVKFGRVRTTVTCLVNAFFCGLDTYSEWLAQLSETQLCVVYWCKMQGIKEENSLHHATCMSVCVQMWCRSANLSSKPLQQPIEEKSRNGAELHWRSSLDHIHVCRILEISLLFRDTSVAFLSMCKDVALSIVASRMNPKIKVLCLHP